jgi:hypothetical protein
MPTEIAFDYLTSDVTLTNVSFMSTQYKIEWIALV